MKGTRLFVDDIVFCLSLIGRALQGYTLKPREVRTLRWETIHLLHCWDDLMRTLFTFSAWLSYCPFVPGGQSKTQSHSFQSWSSCWFPCHQSGTCSCLELSSEYFPTFFPAASLSVVRTCWVSTDTMCHIKCFREKPFLECCLSQLLCPQQFVMFPYLHRAVWIYRILCCHNRRDVVAATHTDFTSNRIFYCTNGYTTIRHHGDIIRSKRFRNWKGHENIGFPSVQ